jgi:two-component system, NtrC family, sensor kinase
MRTLSARILLGFAVLVVTFGALTGNELWNIHTVENEIHLVHKGYLPLARASKELDRKQADLKSFAESYETDPNAYKNVYPARDFALTNLVMQMDVPQGLPENGRKRVRELLSEVQTEVQEIPPLYDKLRTSKRGNDGTLDADGHAALLDLQHAEGRIKGATDRLANELEREVSLIMNTLEDTGHKVGIFTIYFGSAAMILGVLMTIWVVITLRPLHQLREAARRVAAGDYGSRIVERGPAEVSDLAREFNSMGRAIEERERELVRSERLAAVGKMAAMITHEVRNPLSSIGLNTELLEDELADNDELGEAKQLCRAIHREVDRLTQITEEYLAFSRLPKPKIAREAVNTLVRALADFVREDLAAKKVELVVDLSGSDPHALIDAAQVRQCLINLVRNASEAVVVNGGGKVVLRTRKLDQRVVIAVEDDGVGVPSEVLPRLFDPFFSTKDNGSGLGLALTQQIVKDHGGDVSVDSVVGKGTTFTVSVPAA